MRTDLSIVLLTGDGLRHRYAAARLAATTHLAGVVRETKMPAVVEPPASREDREVLARHFAERDTAEQRLLGEEIPFPDRPRLEIPSGTINAPEVCAWVQERRPDYVVLFGTGIVRAPLLERFAGRLVNLHLGLSPYYRGSATNFWPLVQAEPECVGATIHLAVAAVDAGPILAQVRPAVEPADRAHELGTKALMTALDVLPGVLERLATGALAPHVQDLSRGRVFRRSDFTADAVRTMWAHLASGMIPAYLADAPRRRAAYPIVEVAP
jgi:methionyl-tRNA formyltransferase